MRNHRGTTVRTTVPLRVLAAQPSLDATATGTIILSPNSEPPATAAHAGQAARFQVEPNLSKPADPGDSRALTMRAGRLHKNFHVANRMESYAKRLRLRIEHLDLSEQN